MSDDDVICGITAKMWAKTLDRLSELEASSASHTEHIEDLESNLKFHSNRLSNGVEELEESRDILLRDQKGNIEAFKIQRDQIAELRLKVDNPEWLDVLILDLMKPMKEVLQKFFTYLAGYYKLDKPMFYKQLQELLAKLDSQGKTVGQWECEHSLEIKGEYEICKFCGYVSPKRIDSEDWNTPEHMKADLKEVVKSHGDIFPELKKIVEDSGGVKIVDPCNPCLHPILLCNECPVYLASGGEKAFKQGRRGGGDVYIGSQREEYDNGFDGFLGSNEARKEHLKKPPEPNCINRDMVECPNRECPCDAFESIYEPKKTDAVDALIHSLYPMVKDFTDYKLVKREDLQWLFNQLESWIKDQFEGTKALSRHLTPVNLLKEAYGIE